MKISGYSTELLKAMKESGTPRDMKVLILSQSDADWERDRLKHIGITQALAGIISGPAPASHQPSN